MNPEKTNMYRKSVYQPLKSKGRAGLSIFVLVGHLSEVNDARELQAALLAVGLMIQPSTPVGDRPTFA